MSSRLAALLSFIVPSKATGTSQPLRCYWSTVPPDSVGDHSVSMGAS